MASAYAWQPVAAALCSMHVAPKAANVWLLKPDDTLPAAGVTGDRSQEHLQTHLLDFARERRIVKTDEFSSVFRLRPVQRTAHFVLFARINQLPHARLGVVAAKRFAPRAVTRNTIKRITRELFRMTPLPSIDCVVRLSKPVNSKAEPATSVPLRVALRAELTSLFALPGLPQETR
jgi:ribonuclease P protein component